MSVKKNKRIGVADRPKPLVILIAGGEKLIIHSFPKSTDNQKC